MERLCVRIKEEMRKYPILYQHGVKTVSYTHLIPSNLIIPAYTNAPFLLILPEKGHVHNLFTHAFVVTIAYNRCTFQRGMKNLIFQMNNLSKSPFSLNISVAVIDLIECTVI